VLQSQTAAFRFRPLKFGFGGVKCRTSSRVDSLEAKRGYADRSIAAMMDYHAIADVEAYPRVRSQSILVPEQPYRRCFWPCDRKFTYPGLRPYWPRNVELDTGRETRRRHAQQRFLDMVPCSRLIGLRRVSL